MKMRNVKLGSTGIVVPQNGFGALPVQRDDMETAVKILRKAYEGGMTFFDTARAYSDSEEKVGNALADVRSNIYIATKTMAQNLEDMKKQLDTSLSLLKTDYIDVYQFHCASKVFAPGDGSGMYEYMEELKKQGVIRHIGITAHKLEVAKEAIKSGLYETLQFPLSYLSTDKEIKLVDDCIKADMGFIGMKGLAGGLINNSCAAQAFMCQFDNVIPIWGIQRETELDEWLSYMDDMPMMDDEMKAFIEAEKKAMAGDFCRGCGYCMPCPKGIVINQCARMSLMVRRAPSASWTNEYWQGEMKKVEDCINCGACMKKCPYELNTPELLKKNYEDYKKIISGEITV